MRSRRSPTGSSSNLDTPDNSRLLQGLFTSFRANTPWLYLDIDRDKAKLAGVSISELFNTLQVYLGSLYVNDFNRFGRTWQVNVQGEANFRKQINDLTGSGCATHAGAWCRWGRSPRSATSAARSCSSATTCTRRPRST